MTDVFVDTVDIWPEDASSVIEGVVAHWFVAPGGHISRGQPIGEVQIEKLTVEVTAPVGGELVELFVDEHDEFRRGDTLARLRPAE